MRIAMAVFPDVEELDLVGPWEVLAYWATEFADDDVSVTTVAEVAGPLRCSKGLTIVPDLTWAELGGGAGDPALGVAQARASGLDVVLVPGGKGNRPLLAHDHPLHARLRHLAEAGTLITSVCTGSLVLAAAGLLAGRPATTYFGYLDQLQAIDPSIEVRAEDRFVDAGDVVTSAGVSAGIDMALHLVARLHSVERARQVRRGIQYDPQPPV